MSAGIFGSVRSKLPITVANQERPATRSASEASAKGLPARPLNTCSLVPALPGLRQAEARDLGIGGAIVILASHHKMSGDLRGQWRIVAAKRAGQMLGSRAVGGMGALPDDLKHVHAGTLQEHLQPVNKLPCVYSGPSLP